MIGGEQQMDTIKEGCRRAGRRDAKALGPLSGSPDLSVCSFR